MDSNAISLAARTLRTHLVNALQLDERNVFIGHLAPAAKEAEGKVDSQFLNLFFFQFEHGGYPANATSDEPVYIRLHCLITAFGNNESDNESSSVVSAGENDLRLIGGVLAALHQQPVLDITDQSGTANATLQIVPTSFTSESINNLWTAQQEVSYRPSVAYELALVPVPFTSRTERSRRVIYADVDVETFAEHQGLETDWVPEIHFRDSDGTLRNALEFTPINPPDQVEVVVNGVADASVTLSWEIWDPEHGWLADVDSAQDIVIDPALPVHLIDLPGPVGGQNGQNLLVASRTYQRVPGAPITVRSNPLLVSFFEEQA